MSSPKGLWMVVFDAGSSIALFLDIFLTIYGLVSKKNICGGQDLGPSCNERRTGILVAGLVITAGGVALWKFGKNRSAVGEAVFVPGGVMIRQRIGF